MAPPRTDLATILEQTALLSSLSRSEFQSLAARTVRKHFTTGVLLFSEDEPCHGLHIIAHGKVRIFKTSVNGREQVLAINQAGESVAELPVFDGGRYPASAMAIEDTEIAFISRQDFHAFCMEHPEVALKLLAVVGARLRRLVAIIEELSFTTIRQRPLWRFFPTRDGQWVLWRWRDFFRTTNWRRLTCWCWWTRSSYRWACCASGPAAAPAGITA